MEVICVPYHWYLKFGFLAGTRTTAPKSFKRISGGRVVSVIETETRQYRRLVGMQLVIIILETNMESNSSKQSGNLIYKCLYLYKDCIQLNKYKHIQLESRKEFESIYNKSYLGLKSKVQQKSAVLCKISMSSHTGEALLHSQWSLEGP